MPGPPSPDPVSQAAEYVQHLLGLLGDDDPAEAQTTAPATWRSLADEAGDRIRDRPERKEWSVLECLGHAVDAEIVSSARYRWIVAHDQPALIGYDQDLWVDRLRHHDDDPPRLLEVLAVLRASNIDLWRRSSEAERQRFGVHAERGNESFDLLFRMIAGHDRFHLAQGRRALESARV
jgi:DinB superfamily